MPLVPFTPVPSPDDELRAAEEREYLYPMKRLEIAMLATNGDLRAAQELLVMLWKRDYSKPPPKQETGALD